MADAGSSFLKTIFKVVIALFALVVLGIGLLYVFFPSDMVRDEAARYTRENFQREVSIGDVGLSLWPIGIRIGDVLVRNQAGFGGDPLFMLNELVVDVDLGALIFDQAVRIEQIIIREPRINVIIKPDGTSNLDGLVAEEGEEVVEEPVEPEEEGRTTVTVEVEADSGEGLPFAFTLEEFRIIDGYVRYVDGVEGMEAVIGKINQFVTVDIDTTLNPIIADGNLRLDEISFRSGDMSVGPTSFHLNHVTRTSVPDDSTWFQIVVNAMDIPVAFIGRVYNMSTVPDVRLDLATGEIDLSRMSGNLAGVASDVAAMNLAGRILMDFHLRTVMEPDVETPPLNFDGSVQFREISAAVPGLLVPVERVHGDINFTHEQVVIPDIEVKAGSTEVHLADVLVRDFMTMGEEDAPPMSAQFAVRGPMINIDELIEIPEDTVEPEPIADTTVIFDMAPLPPMVVNGVVEIGAVKFTDLHLTQIRSTMNVEEQRAAVDLNSRLYNGTIAGDGYLDVADTTDVGYGGNWNVNGVEANDLLSVLTSFDDRFFGGATSTGHIVGHGNTYGELKQNLNGDVHVTAGNGRFVNVPAVQQISEKIGLGVDRVKDGWGTSAVQRMGLNQDAINYGQFDASYHIENGRVIVRNLNTTARDQLWDVRGWVSLSGPMDLVTSVTCSEDITMELARSAASAVSSIYSMSAEDLAATLEPPNHLKIDLPVRGTTDDPEVGMPDLMAPFRNAATNAARQGLDRARRTAEERARQAREEAEQRAREEADRLRREAEERARQERERAEQRVQEEAGSRLRGLLGR